MRDGRHRAPRGQDGLVMTRMTNDERGTCVPSCPAAPPAKIIARSRAARSSTRPRARAGLAAQLCGQGVAHDEGGVQALPPAQSCELRGRCGGARIAGPLQQRAGEELHVGSRRRSVGLCHNDALLQQEPWKGAHFGP